VTSPEAPVVIVDELVARPGRAAEVLSRYRQEYVPAARERGLRLLHEWVSPPVLLEHGSNTLVVVWGVDGPDGWWRARAGGRDPGVIGFWERLTPLLEVRRRRHLAEAADLDRLNGAGR
jgi:hypothetical protein